LGGKKAFAPVGGLCVRAPFIFVRVCVPCGVVPWMGWHWKPREVHRA
jgi:hypothetical protein